MKHFMLYGFIFFLLCCSPAFVQEQKVASLLKSQKIAQLATPLLVLVEIDFVLFNKTEKEPLKEFYYAGRLPDFLEDSILENVSHKRTLIVPGYVVNSGYILLEDPHLKWERVQSITVFDFAGVSYPAQFAGFLKKSDGVLLRCEALSFSVNLASNRMLYIEDTYYHVSLKGKNQQHNVSVQIAPLQTHFLWDQSKPRYGLNVSTGLVFNQKEEFVGFTLPGFPSIQSLSYFSEGPLTSNHFVDFETYQSLKNQLLTAIEACQAYLKINFRKEDSSSYYYQEERVGQEEELYGYVLSSGIIFVPSDLSKKSVESIKSIEVQFQGQTVEGEFRGLFKEFGGFLVSAPVEMKPNALFQEIEDDSSSTMLFSVLSLHSFGALKTRMYATHKIPVKRRGYKGLYFSDITHQVLPGTLYCRWNEITNTFFLTGFGLIEKKYDNPASLENEEHRSTGLKSHFFDYQFIQERLKNPELYFDPQAKVKTLLESKEMAWLGIEFQFLNSPLSKALEVQEITKDGNMGILIKDIYENSPAVRLGLQVGDILLTLQEEGKDQIHLNRDPYAYDYSYSYGRAGYPGTSWFQRSNYLTKILSKMNSGAQVSLTYYSQGQVLTKTFPVEKAPKDFSSTEKYKDDWSGLTVKDITYEVRRRLKLSNDFQGVIVYRIEPGSGASVAKIKYLDFIETIEEQPVKSIQDFQSILEKLIAEKKESAKFRVRTFDETWFADVKLKKE